MNFEFQIYKITRPQSTNNTQPIVQSSQSIMKDFILCFSLFVLVPKLLFAGGSANNSVIELNVGGVHFVTTLETLLSRESFLSKRFSGDYGEEPMLHGQHFIDRDGTYFDHILEFLRNDGIVYLPVSMDEVALLRLQREADFFGLTDLVRLVVRIRHDRPDHQQMKQEMNAKMLSHMSGIVQQLQMIDKKLANEVSPEHSVGNALYSLVHTLQEGIYKGPQLA